MWYNTTATHFRTHCAEKHAGQSGGQGPYNDVMVAHDEHIGQMLKKLDDLGIADNTIVMYSTDNGHLGSIRYHDWKFVFMEQRAKQMICWVTSRSGLLGMRQIVWALCSWACGCIEGR